MPACVGVSHTGAGQALACGAAETSLGPRRHKLGRAHTIPWLGDTQAMKAGNQGIFKLPRDDCEAVIACPVPPK